jgi:hypothetical protein
VSDWKATKLCVAAGYSEQDGIYRLVEPDDKQATQWFVLVFVPPGVDPRASGWVLGEGWLGNAPTPASIPAWSRSHRR